MTQIQRIAEILASPPRYNLGITAAPPQPAKAPPAATLNHPPSLEGYLQAMDVARAHWPGRDALALIASDELEPRGAAALPPGMAILKDPVVILDLNPGHAQGAIDAGEARARRDSERNLVPGQSAELPGTRGGGRGYASPLPAGHGDDDTSDIDASADGRGGFDELTSTDPMSGAPLGDFPAPDMP